MISWQAAGQAAAVARAGALLALLALLEGTSGCGEYASPILVTLVNANPDAEAIRLTPWLAGRKGEVRTLVLPTRQLVLEVPAGLGGMLRLEAEAVSSTLSGCTLGRLATEIDVEPGFTRPTPVYVDLGMMDRAKCPLIVAPSPLRVTSDSLAINCGDACQADLAAGTVVTLTAAIGTDHTMVIWGDDCSGALDRSCKVKMTQARQVSLQQWPELRPKMLPLLPGTFAMGSPASDMNRAPNEQQHAVQLTTAFALSETEVTQRQYAQLLGTNPSQFPGDPERPIENVSWWEAVAYCNQLSLKEGLPPCYQLDGQNVGWPQGLKCRGYRLPTEAEWEYAARANSGQYQQYAGSDVAGDVAWYNVNATNTTHPVRTKQANQWGLYDLSGNVWEYVWDFYGNYPTTPLAVDPTGPPSGPDRVVRGGSYDDVALDARVAYRLGSGPSNRYGSLGFRVARSYP